MRRLALSLLTSPAEPPAGQGEAGALARSRVELLTAMGARDAAIAPPPGGRAGGRRGGHRPDHERPPARGARLRRRVRAHPGQGGPRGRVLAPGAHSLSGPRRPDRGCDARARTPAGDGCCARSSLRRRDLRHGRAGRASGGRACRSHRLACRRLAAGTAADSRRGGREGGARSVARNCRRPGIAAGCQADGGRARRGDRRALHRIPARPLYREMAFSAEERADAPGAGRSAGAAARPSAHAAGNRSPDGTRLAGRAAGGRALPGRGAGRLRDGGTVVCGGGADRSVHAGACLVQRHCRAGAVCGRRPGGGCVLVRARQPGSPARSRGGARRGAALAADAPERRRDSPEDGPLRGMAGAAGPTRGERAVALVRANWLVMLVDALGGRIDPEVWDRLLAEGAADAGPGAGAGARAWPSHGGRRGAARRERPDGAAPAG